MGSPIGTLPMAEKDSGSTEGKDASLGRNNRIWGVGDWEVHSC